MPDPTREELLVAAAISRIQYEAEHATIADAAAALRHECDTVADPKFTDAEFAQLIEAARALLGDGWQDIATAPKDGTPILGYDARLATPALSCTMAVIFFDANGVVSGLPRMWWGTTPGSLVMIAPTHWRPLPAPPSEKSDG